MSNTYTLVVELPKSDGFHTRDDHHLAEIAKGYAERGMAGQFHPASDPVIRIVKKTEKGDGSE